MTLRTDYGHWARSFSRRVGEGWGEFLDAISALIDTVDYSVVSGNDGDTDVSAAELEELTDGSSTTLHEHAYDYSDISGNDGDTDVSGGELEELTDGSTTTLHEHAYDYSDISGNDASTDVTAAELEELTDGSTTSLHDHASAGTLHGLTVQRLHLAKQSATQNLGGANGTTVAITWDRQYEAGSDFTHSTSTNPSRIQFDFDGRVHVKASVSAEQGGSSRTTLAIYGRYNGSVDIPQATHRNYSRGSSYGDISLIWDTEINVFDGLYIEIMTIVDDTDSTYTINTFDDECEVIVTRIG